MAMVAVVVTEIQQPVASVVQVVLVVRVQTVVTAVTVVPAETVAPMALAAKVQESVVPAAEAVTDRSSMAMEEMAAAAETVEQTVGPADLQVAVLVLLVAPGNPAQRHRV